MDTNVIKLLKSKYDLTKDEDILALYAVLQSGEYMLVTPEEREFDDEVYELALAAKQRKAGNINNRGYINKTNKKRNIKNNIKKINDKKNTDKENNDSKNNVKKNKNRKVIILTKAQLRVRRLLTGLLMLIAIGCFTYFGYYCYEAYQAEQVKQSLSSKKENNAVNSMYKDQKIEVTDEVGQEVTLTVLDEYKSLYNQNKNLIGWLKIADTNIDNPVMQTKDNTYYLDHNIDQQKDKNGTLFLDSSCDIIKKSTNLIIYGHNMRSGNMFGNLDKYKSESYYKKHPTIQFDTIYEKGTYQIMYVFTSHIYKEDEIVFKYYQFIEAASQKEFDSNMQSMQEMSLYDTGIEANYGDQLLTLSTCDYEEVDGRFVVVAKRIQ